MRLKSSYWIYSAIFSFLQRFSIILFGTLTYVILAKFTFSPEQMGSWVIFLTITSVIESAKLGLLRNTTIKFFNSSDYVGNKNSVQSASLGLNILFTIFIIILIFVFAPSFSKFLKSPEISPLLYLSIILFILQIPFHHCELIQQSHLQYSPSFWAYFIRQGIFFASILVLVLFFKTYITFVNLVWLQVLSLSAGLVYFLLATRKFLFHHFSFNKKLIAQMFTFGKYVLGTNLFSNLARYTDHFITANAIGNPVLGKIYVSYYNAVSRIVGLIDLPSFAITDILFPKSVQLVETNGNGKIRYYVEKSLGINLAIIIPVCIIIFFFSDTIITLFAGKKYLPAVPILQFTVLFAFLRPISPQFGFTMDSIGKPQINFWVNMGSLVLNIVLTYVAYKFFDVGKFGALYGNLLSTICTFFITYYYLQKELGVKLKSILYYTLTAYKEIYMMIKDKIAKKKLVNNTV